jgi:hypothetical protein
VNWGDNLPDKLYRKDVGAAGDDKDSQIGSFLNPRTAKVHSAVTVQTGSMGTQAVENLRISVPCEGDAEVKAGTSLGKGKRTSKLSLAEARRQRALEAGQYDQIQDAPEVINISGIFRADRRSLASRSRQQRKWSGSPSDVPPDESLVARARVGSLKADAIFDTGAQVTTMSVAFYKRLGCPVLLNVPASASGADGTGLRLIGAVGMELAIGTRKFPFRAWVIEGLRADVLVGLDFMRQFPTKVDVAEGKISI